MEKNTNLVQIEINQVSFWISIHVIFLNTVTVTSRENRIKTKQLLDSVLPCPQEKCALNKNFLIRKHETDYFNLLSDINRHKIINKQQEFTSSDGVRGVGMFRGECIVVCGEDGTDESDEEPAATSSEDWFAVMDEDEAAVLCKDEAAVRGKDEAAVLGKDETAVLGKDEAAMTELLAFCLSK